MLNNQKKPASQVYIKCYVQMNDLSEQFYRDGNDEATRRSASPGFHAKTHPANSACRLQRVFMSHQWLCPLPHPLYTGYTDLNGRFEYLASNKSDIANI